MGKLILSQAGRACLRALATGQGHYLSHNGGYQECIIKGLVKGGFEPTLTPRGVDAAVEREMIPPPAKKKVKRA